MNAQDLLSIFRKMVDDTAEPYFWSDDVFYLYLSDAIYKYCENGKAIRDHTSELTVLEYTANDPWINLDERILRIISANDENNSHRPLRILDWDTYNRSGYGRSSDYNMCYQVARYPDATGSLEALILGMSENQIRLTNIPTVQGTIKIVIERYPLEPISENNLEIEGVPLTDKMNLLNWVKHMAYAHQDAETFDPKKSLIAKEMFERELREVDSRRMKKSHKPNVTQYGGI